MGQYYGIKKKIPEAIIFFRMGDFYEIFGDDALEVGPKLDLTLTSRERGDKNRVPFCGVPHHSARNYWLRLLQQGYKVAIADQVEDAKEAKGLVNREVTQILTPGSVDDLDALDASSPNYLLALYEVPSSRRVAVAVADCSTGELRLGELDDKASILPVVEKFRPKEIIARKFFLSGLESILGHFLKSHKLAFASLPEGVLQDSEEQSRILTQLFGGRELQKQQCGPCEGGDALVASLMSYLRSLHVTTDQFVSVRPLVDPDTMVLDEVCRRDLELFETSRRRSRDGSLFWEINRTLSAMGARALHNCLLNPLLSGPKIRQRQEGVTLLLDSPEVLEDLRDALSNLPDLERLVTRILSGRARVDELVKIRNSLRVANNVLDLLGKESFSDRNYYEGLLQQLGEGQEALELLDAALVEEPGALGSLEVFRDEFDGSMAKLRERALNGEAEIRSYEAGLRQSTAINSLKIKKHKTFGLLIEVTKSNLTKVPDDFIRRQTMVNNERFVTPELQELSESLDQALDLALSHEKLLMEGVFQKLSGFALGLRKVAHALGQWDLLQSFAEKARAEQYCKPELSEDGKILLRQSRHPVVERFVGRHQFMVNDIIVEHERKSLLITGPNMAGKSTVMRQLALSAILHQIGSYVPAAFAKLPIFDRVFTRVGASDDLAMGQSTFMVEMTEAASILRQATGRSLVILDEVGRGTSTEDGQAIALAIFEDLTNRLGCYLLFATHFHDMIPTLRSMPGVEMVQTEVIEGDSIEFTHRLIPGAASSSFGVEVAKLAGLPPGVIKRSLDYLENHHERSDTRSSLAATGFQLGSDPHDGLSQKERQVIEKIEGVNLNRMTPIQSLNFIYNMKLLLEDAEQLQIFKGSREGH